MNHNALQEDSGEANTTRRQWIRPASGVLLAAGGLVLPARREEAEARPGGSRDGELGGRHGKNQRGRKQDRDHGQKKDRHDGPPPGRGIFELRTMAIVVHNYRPFPVQVRGWQHDDCAGCISWSIPSEWAWSEIPGRTGVPHFTKEFYGDKTWVAVQIGTDRAVTGMNRLEGPPIATILSGGWGNHGAVGGDELSRSVLFVSWNIFADGIRITRVDDTDEHILYSVDLT